MKPYYQDVNCEIWHGDCREVMPLLRGRAIDVVIADPPYVETACKWDVWPQGWPALARELCPLLWCFGSFRMFWNYQSEFVGWDNVQEVIWEKHNGSGMHKDRFRRVHELIAQFRDERVRWKDCYKQPQYTRDALPRTIRRVQKPRHWNKITQSLYASEDGGPRLMRSVQRVRSCHGAAVHETQKPLGIVTPLIAYSCPPGGTIVDPCAGSGSFLRAALNLGVKSIGIETDERCCELAVKRMQLRPRATESKRELVAVHAQGTLEI